MHGIDSAPAINRALVAAGERGGGTVLLPPGTYRIDDYLRIGHSGVVLRGAGSGRTTLLATRNLTELIGPYGSRYGGDKSDRRPGLRGRAPRARGGVRKPGVGASAEPVRGAAGAQGR